MNEIAPPGVGNKVGAARGGKRPNKMGGRRDMASIYRNAFSAIDRKIADNGLQCITYRNGDYTVIRLSGDGFRRSEWVLGKNPTHINSAKKGLFDRYIIDDRLRRYEESKIN